MGKRNRRKKIRNHDLAISILNLITAILTALTAILYILKG